MAKDILEQKVGKLTLLDGAFIGASKLGTEALMSKIPFVGNGTLRSGLIKGALAVGGSMLTNNNKALQIVSTGVLIDGMEDLALSVRKMLRNGTQTQNQTVEQNAF